MYTNQTDKRVMLQQSPLIYISEHTIEGVHLQEEKRVDAREKTWESHLSMELDEADYSCSNEV